MKSIKITIQDDLFDNLSSAAQDTLKDEMEKYCQKVVTEACLLEDHSKEEGASTEVTSTTIMLAIKALKTHRRRRRGKLEKIGRITIKVLASALAFWAGILFDFDKIQESQLYCGVFLAVAMLACLTSILSIVIEEKED